MVIDFNIFLTCILQQIFYYILLYTNYCDRRWRELKITVYADVLFVTNFVINYILLYITSLLSGGKHSVFRLSLAASTGAVYAVCMFMPMFSTAFSLAGKLILSLVICALAFGCIPIKKYIKRLGFFYAVSLLCGGIVTAIVSPGGGSALSANNGIIYFNTDIYTIKLSSPRPSRRTIYSILHIT